MDAVEMGSMLGLGGDEGVDLHHGSRLLAGSGGDYHSALLNQDNKVIKHRVYISGMFDKPGNPS